MAYSVSGCDINTNVLKGRDALETNVQVLNMAKELENTDLQSLIHCVAHNEKTDTFCKECNVLVCPQCASAEHTGHTIDNLHALTTEQRKMLESLLFDTKGEEAICMQSVQELQILKENVAQSVADEGREIDRTVDFWIAEVLREGQVLKNQLQQIGNARLGKIEQEINRIEARSSKLTSASGIAREICTWPDHAYVYQHDALIKKMKTLSVGQNISVNTNPHSAKFIKEPGKPSTHIGKVLKVVTPCKLKLVQVLNGFDDAHNVTMSSNNTIAVCNSYYGKKEVLIYQQNLQGEFVKHITLKLQPANQWGPKGIVISQDGCFFVAKKTGIEVYSPDGEYLKTIITRSKELSDEEVNVSSVAALSDGRILAGDIDRSIITEHDTCGKIVWMLRTSIRPHYIASINDEQVAVADHNSNKVIVLDIKTGIEILRMDIPLVQAVCYDAQTESLLIVRNEGSQYQQAISRTGVVEQYCCSTGQFVARLAHGLYYPKGLALTSNGFFAVADQKTVNVYQIM